MGKRAERVRDSFMGRTAESLKRDSPVAERGGEKDEGGGEREEGKTSRFSSLSVRKKSERFTESEGKERERIKRALPAALSLNALFRHPICSAFRSIPLRRTPCTKTVDTHGVRFGTRSCEAERARAAAAGFEGNDGERVESEREKRSVRYSKKGRPLARMILLRFPRPDTSFSRSKWHFRQHNGRG